MILPILECIQAALSDKYTFSPNPQRLGAFTKINVFVGPNNSGKSRFIRHLIDLHSNRSIFDGSPKNLEASRLLEQWYDRLSSLPEDIDQSLKEQISRVDRYIGFRASSIGSNDLRNIENSISFMYAHRHNELGNIATNLILKRGNMGENIDKTPNAIYIPSLRTFRSPEDNPKYFSKIAKDDYFKETRGSTLVIDCGGDMYSRLKRFLLGERKQRDTIRKFERFISTHFLEKRSVTLIPRENDKHVFIKIGKEQEQAIPHLGDGIQQLVIMLFSAFTSNEPVALFIEEPELFLHPGYQTRFLKCFDQEELKHVQLFFTTHSNHLINLTLDKNTTSVFRITKDSDHEEDDSLPRCNVHRVIDDGKEVLNQIGVVRSSMLLSSCSIMVEGPTDRRYFQKYLEIYMDTMQSTAADKSKRFQSFLLDLHYSFVEYGGSNIVQWGFVSSKGTMDFKRILGTEILVIMDKDSSKSKDERYSQMKESLGDRLLRLEVLEVENLLSPCTIQHVVESYEGEKHPEIGGLRSTSYANKRLGAFIESLITSKRISTSGHPYAVVGKNGKGGGTLKDKVKFCDIALEHIRTRKDMTDDAWELAEKLYSFIAKHN